MKKNLIACFMALFSLNSIAQSNYSVVPKPQELQPINGSFKVNSSSSVLENSEFKDIASLFVEQMTSLNKTSLKLSNEAQASNQIQFLVDKSLADEAYKISVNENGIKISAKDGRGFFYGSQTVLQLANLNADNAGVSVPNCEIFDVPRFNYRGFMLDVGRHMMPVATIKKFIDVIALYKLNTFHWHLTEDQGWRIEIKKYPNLTKVGAYRKSSPVGHNNENKQDNKPYGGFYTQEEVKEVVAYAQKKYVNIIPEIEMPGHAVAALASYPYLGCSGGPYEVRTTWGVATEVFCPYEETFTFLEDVLSEVMELFPSKYIHIGGDECPKVSWENSEYCQNLIKKEGLKDEHGLQSYFISRIDKFLDSKGRTIIGWDEILEGGLSPNAIVMSWRGVEGGLEAAKLNHDFIMTPNQFLYLDYYQADPENEPLAIGGYLPIEKVYNYEPVPDDMPKMEADHLLGLQANLWTEYIDNPEKAEYMAYPRLLALSESAWSSKESKDYVNFSKRVKNQFKLLDAMNVNYSEAIFNLNMNPEMTEPGMVGVSYNKAFDDLTIRYTEDNKEPDLNSKKLIDGEKLIIKKDATIKASSFDEKGKKLGNTKTQKFVVSKISNVPYELNLQANRFTGTSKYGLTDGIKGHERQLKDWFGFSDDLEISMNLPSKMKLSTYKTTYIHAPNARVFGPSGTEIYVSKNGRKYKKVGEHVLDNNLGKDLKVLNEVINFSPKKAKYVKIKIKNHGRIPEGYRFEGTMPYILLDEIELD